MMLRNPINRNDDAGGNGGGAAAAVETPTAPIVKGFEALSETGIIEEVANSATSAAAETPEQIQAKADAAAKAAEGNGGVAPVVETPEQIQAKADLASAAALEIKLDDKGNQVDDKGAIIKTKEQLDADKANEVITEFKIDGEENVATPGAETPEQLQRKKALEDFAKDSSWTALAKTQNIDITENTFEAYEAGMQQKFETEKTTILTTAKEAAKAELLAEKPVEVMAILEGLEQGATIEQLLQPTKEIEALEALSNAELIAEDRRLLGWTQDLIDKEIAHLTEKDLLDVTAQPLRDFLKANKENIAADQLEQFTALKQSKLAKISEARVRESEEIKNTLVSMKTYMGVPVDDKVVNHIQQKWNKGEYHEAFKDSKTIAEFLMYKEFGPQGLKALENRAYQRGRDEKAMKLHNVPPLVDAGGKTTSTQTVKAEGNFGALPVPQG